MELLIIGGVVALVVFSDKIPLFKSLFDPTNSPVGAGGAAAQNAGRAPKQGAKNQGPPNQTGGSPASSPNATIQTIEGGVAIANQALGYLKNLKDYTDSGSDGDSEYPVTTVANPGWQPAPIIFNPIIIRDFTDNDSPSDSSFTSAPSNDSSFTDTGP